MLNQISISGDVAVLMEDDFASDTLLLSVEGNGNISMQDNEFSSDTILLNISGDGRIDGTFYRTSLYSKMSDSAQYELWGQVSNYFIEVDGSGTIEAYSLVSLNTEIRVDGSATCKITVQEQLRVDVDGVASVFYCGTPIVEKHINGVGAVRNVEQ